MLLLRLPWPLPDVGRLIAVCRPRLRPAGLPTAWIGGYLATVLLLQHFDPFGADFETSGPILLLCNLARLSFLVYFASTLLGLGLLVLGPPEKASLPGLGYLERLLLGFWLGAAILTLVMLPLGFLGLYYRLTALVLSVPILFLSFPALVDCLAAGKHLLADHCRQVRVRPLATLPSVVAVGGIASFLLLLLLTRCLYPGETTDDVYEHYWPYQQEVLRSHGIWPNDVWYDFYTAKGFGLNFLAMLLTDDLACQSVTYLLLAASAGLLFTVTRRLTGRSFWALLSTAVYLGAFPFPLTVPLRWGGFQSHHLPATAWVWLHDLDGSRHAGRAPLAPAGLVRHLLPSGGRFHGVLPAFHRLHPVLARHSNGSARADEAMGRRPLVPSDRGRRCDSAGRLAVSELRSNRHGKRQPQAGGLDSRRPAALSRWCSPYLVEFFNEVSEDYEGAINVPHFVNHSVKHFERLARVKYIRGYYPGHAGVMLLALAAALGAWIRRASTGARPIHLALMVPFLALAATIGDVLKLDASIYRNYVFLLFFVCALLGLAWMLAFAWVPRKVSAWVLPIFAVIAVATTEIEVFRRHAARRDHAGSLTDYARFAAGQLSVRDALSRGDGLWAEAVEAKKRVGFHTPILCLSRVDYAIPGLAAHVFPGNGLLTEPSRTSLGGQWHIVAFEDAATARRVLADQGIHYFLVDPSQDLVGCIPFSSLFEPDGLAGRFRVVESWGNLHLLTWAGNAGDPLPDRFVRLYRDRLASLRQKQHACIRLYDILAASYRFNKGRGYPLTRPPGLPRLIPGPS